MKTPIANYVMGRYGLEIKIKWDQAQGSVPMIRTARDPYRLALRELKRVER